jgi:cytosine/adenosine deaminase-related metal-dependent hydrolase
VGIGCDGAPCNNALDGFIEMHIAALLQKVKNGATAMPVLDVLRMATMGGAIALGIDNEVGSIEIGKRADLIVVDGAKPHLRPIADPVTTIVHAARGSDVRDVFVNGRLLVKDRQLTTMDLSQVLENAERESGRR